MVSRQPTPGVHEAFAENASASPAPQTHVPGVVEFNFNESISVRLTEEGRRILAEKHEELRKRFPKIGPYTPKREDAEGRVSFQFWDLMRTFGPYMFLGNPRPPIEGDIQFKASASSWRYDEPEAGEHQEVLDAIAAHNSGEEE